MNTSRIALIGLALLASAAPVPDQRLAFEPAQGSLAWKRFELEASGAVDDAEIVVNGEAQDAALVGIDAEFDGRASYVLAFLDEYRSVADGRPLELARTIEEMVLTAELNGGEPDVTESGDMLGKTIVFVWDEESETYERSFEDGTEDEENQLTGFAVDTDLRALLPDDAVSEGELWDGDPIALLKLGLPGIDLRSIAAGEVGSISAEIVDEFLRVFGGAEAKVRYVGTVEQDDKKLQRLELAWRLDTTEKRDPALFADEILASGALLEEVSLEVDLELGGVFLWDAEVGRWHVFELTGEGSAVLSTKLTAPISEEDVPVEMRFEVSGELSVNGEAEAR